MDRAQLLNKEKINLFYLEYWKHLLVRIQLDVMDIAKNVCNNIYDTLLHQSRKTKDEINAKKDLRHLNLVKNLNTTCMALVLDDHTKVLPSIPYTLSKNEKKNVL